MNDFTKNQVAVNGRLAAGMTLFSVLWLAGCTGSQPSDQQVRQQAAQTTAEVKQGAKQAVSATQAAAGVAVRDVNDVAAGVKQAWDRTGHRPLQIPAVSI